MFEFFSSRGLLTVTRPIGSWLFYLFRNLAPKTYNKNTNEKSINYIATAKTKQNGVVWYYSQWTHNRKKFTSHCIFLGGFQGRIHYVVMQRKCFFQSPWWPKEEEYVWWCQMQEDIEKIKRLNQCSKINDFP